MQLRPYAHDAHALWRALCPRIYSAAPWPAHRSAGPPIAPRRAIRKPACLSCVSTTSDRRLIHDARIGAPSTSTEAPHAPKQTLNRTSGRARKQPALAHLSTPSLYERIRSEGEKGRFDEVFHVCRVLVKDRGEPPNKEMYNAILHSFVSAPNGTAGKARKVLEEMGFWQPSENIELDARGCQCVLEVLAVHPDYLLRTEILEYMKSRWFALSDRGHNFVVAGLLRERHFEQALDALEAMIQKKIRVEGWLFDLAFWSLLEFGEVEEAFYLLSLQDSIRHQGNGTNSMQLSSALWSSLLDHAARKQLHGPVKLLWDGQVQPGYLKPGTGACLNVLILASRHGDVHLATDVFRVLSERSTSFTTLHYELLVATYLNANDLSAALSVILIMVDANLKVDTGTCQSLYWYLCQASEGEDTTRPMIAFNMLQDLEATGRKIPTAAVNACIQASISLDRFEEAIEFYKALHTVSEAGPDTQTFNILFRGCYLHKRKGLAMFLANEMIQLGLKPDRLTYDRLILVCLQAGDLEDALLYYAEMRTMKARPTTQATLNPRRATWEVLIRNLAKNGDARAVAILKDYQEGTPEPRKGVEHAVKMQFEDNVIGVEAMDRDTNSTRGKDGVKEETQRTDFQ